MSDPTLDRAAVNRLSVTLAKAVYAHYRERMAELGGPRQAIALEVLNALAVNVAFVFSGTGNDAQARAFFDQALATNQDQDFDKVIHG